MFKLMIYEFRKTWITKLILLGITAAAEAAFLFNLYTDKEDGLVASIGILTLLAVSNCKHKESYLDVCVTSCVIPVIISLALSFVWGLFI